MSKSYYENGAIHHDHHKELHIDNVNGGDIGKLISAFFKDDAEDAVIVDETKSEESSLAEDTQRLSGDLATEEAMKYWQRLQKAGFVDADYHLMPGISRKQAMYIAMVFAEKLRMTSIWKPFERLWGKSNLAQEKWDFQQTGSLPSRSKEIDEIFRD